MLIISITTMPIIRSYQLSLHHQHYHINAAYLTCQPYVKNFKETTTKSISGARDFFKRTDEGLGKYQNCVSFMNSMTKHIVAEDTKQWKYKME